MRFGSDLQNLIISGRGYNDMTRHKGSYIESGKSMKTKSSGFQLFKSKKLSNYEKLEIRKRCTQDYRIRQFVLIGGTILLFLTVGFFA